MKARSFVAPAQSIFQRRSAARGRPTAIGRTHQRPLRQALEMPMRNRIDSRGASLQAHVPASVNAHSGPLSTPEPSGISSSARFQRDCSPKPSRPKVWDAVHTEEIKVMFKQMRVARTLRRVLFLAGVAAGTMALSAAAVAGECPADKMKPNVREKVDFKPVGVSDVTLGSIDLEKEAAKNRDRGLGVRT